MNALLSSATMTGTAYWRRSRDGDPLGLLLHRRHYSRRRYRDGRDPALFVGPGEKLVLIAHDDDSPWFDDSVMEQLHRDHLLTWVNSETLTTGIPLFAGHDDEKAVAESPSAAWSRLLDLGVDAVQTELPWLLYHLRSRRELP